MSIGAGAALPAHTPTIALQGSDQASMQPSSMTSPMGVQAPSVFAGNHRHLPIPTRLTPETQEAAQAAFERARAAESRGQREEAIGHYRQALTLNPTLIEAHNNLGALYVRLQQLPAGIDEFRAAIRLDPKYAMVRNNLGSAYILSGEEALAIQEFLEALHIEPTYVSPLYNLASLYARRGDVGQTVAFLTRALALEPAVLSWLQEDSDFDRVKAVPDLQRLYTQAHTTR
jgi:tetratricopeptide (TPR) repeat protein